MAKKKKEAIQLTADDLANLVAGARVAEIERYNESPEGKAFRAGFQESLLRARMKRHAQSAIAGRLGGKATAAEDPYADEKAAFDGMFIAVGCPTLPELKRMAESPEGLPGPLTMEVLKTMQDRITGYSFTLPGRPPWKETPEILRTRCHRLRVRHKREHGEPSI